MLYKHHSPDFQVADGLGPSESSVYRSVRDVAVAICDILFHEEVNFGDEELHEQAV